MSQILRFGTTSAGAGVLTLTGDAGGAISPVLGDIIIAGGTGISTSGAGHTITVALTGALGTTDHCVQVGNATGGIASLAAGTTGTVLCGVTGADPSFSNAVTLATGGSLQTALLAGNTLLIQAYDVDGTAYKPFITLTANNTPTCDLDTDVTIGSAYIYRAGGTDVPVADGGTGLSTLTAHALYVGNGAAAPTALAVGATGEILVGSTGADCAWSSTPTVTTMNATTFDTNVAAAGVTLSGTTLSADGTDADININITAKGSGTVIIDELTLTTDLSVANGGTGASTLTQNGVLYGNAASAIGATAEGGTGTVLIGTTGAAPSWLAAGTDGKVLTAHTGAAPTWETPGGGSTWLTKADATGDATATVNYAYTINHATPASLLTITLPATAAVGDRVEIVGNTAGMWKLVAAAGDTIKLLSSTTSAGGYLLATTQYDCVEVVCTVADTTWVVCKSMGNLTVA